MRHSCWLLVLVFAAGCSEKVVTARNAIPEAIITSPSDGATVIEGAEVLLTGQASDSDDDLTALIAAWSINGVEVCSAAPDASGATTCSTTLSAGEAEVQLLVKDPDGAAGTDRIKLNTTATDAPVASITSPEESSSHRAGDLIRFAGEISDAEDTPDMLTTSWSSSIDGELTDVDVNPTSEGIIEGFTTLSPGEHAIQLDVVDSAGKSGIASVLISVLEANLAPTCEITAPTDGGVGAVDSMVTFTAAVSDDGATDALTATWSSDGADGELGTSGADSEGNITFVYGDLSARTHVISITVTDEEGASCTDDIVYTVGSPPEVVINSPVSTDIHYSDRLITFAGVASDAEDADEDIIINWISSIEGDLTDVDGTVSSDGSFTGFATLTEGEHAITVVATDSTGLTAEDNVIISVGAPNSVPTCGITSPESGELFPSGDTVVFEATANDVDIPSDMLIVAWSSDASGVLGSSTPSSTGSVLFAVSTLPVGTHIITMSVADEVGSTCTDNLLITVGGGPTVAITAPVSGTTVNEGELVNFEGAVADDEDFPTVLTIAWASTADGLIGVDPAALDGTVTLDTATLSTGAHTVSLTATDTDGLSGTASIDLTVNGLPTAPEVGITPDPAATTDDLVASLTTPSTDPEGDSISYTYAWSVDGSPTAHTTDTVPAADTTSGEVWTVTVTSSDGMGDGGSGTASVSVGNTLPVILSVSLSPTTVYTNDTITATVDTDDADGDSTSLSYEWTVGGIVVAETGSTLNGVTYFDKHDVVDLTVTPSDAEGSGLPMTSDSVVVLNSVPTAPELAIDPTAPVEATDPLLCEVSSEATDADGDTITYSATWTVDAAPYTGVTDTAFPGDTVEATATIVDQEWECTVVPNDGDEDGPSASVSITIERQCDWDDDGYLVDSAECAGDDCDDDDASIHPGAEEVWYDGIDTDCSGTSDYDADGDGYDHIDYGGEDCADHDPARIDCSDGIADYLPGEESPNQVAYHSLETDSSNDRLILYGGQSYHEVLATTYAYSLVDDEWTAIDAVGIDPGERMGHASAMDEVGSRMFIYGGQMYHSLSNELLVLDTTPGAESWDLIDTFEGPPPLTGANMLYDDVTDELHVFGGQTYYGLNTELWSYSFGAESWTGSSYSDGPEAAGMVAVWDSDSGMGIVMGGQGYHQLSTESWCFDGASFSELDVTGDPLPPAVGMSGASAPTFGGAVLHGGQTYYNLIGKTYLVRITDTCAVEVEELVDGGDTPAPVVGGAMAWSSADAEAFVVAGQTFYALSDGVTGITP